MMITGFAIHDHLKVGMYLAHLGSNLDLIAVVLIILKEGDVGIHVRLEPSFIRVAVQDVDGNFGRRARLEGHHLQATPFSKCSLSRNVPFSIKFTMESSQCYINFSPKHTF